jgi:putative ABC transport system permease protein
VIGADVKAAFNTLRRSPGAPIVASLSLALGMALATVVFSMLEAAFLHPLPYAHAERLYQVSTFEPRSQARRDAVSSRHLLAIQSQARSLEIIGASQNTHRGALLGESGDATSVSASSMTTNFLDVYGIRPIVGRPFETQDVGTNRVLISEALWKSRFASSRGVVGSSITLDGRRTEVIGVLPKVFRSGVAVWRPLGDAEIRADVLRGGWTTYEVTMLARPNSAREAIDAELSVILARADAGVPNTTVTLSRVATLAEVYRGSWRGGLGLWTAIAGIVALICAVNFATVSLARGMRRRAEIAVRTALGASAGRIVALLTWEAAMIAAVGGVFAVVLAGWLIGARLAALGADMLYAPELSWRVAAAGVAATVMVGFVFALAPALQLAHANLRPLLSGSSQTGGGRKDVQSRRGLVALQLGLSLASITVMASLVSLQRSKLGQGPGYAYEQFVTANVYLRDSSAQLSVEGLHEFIRAMPGVQAATVGNHPDPYATFFQVEGRRLPAAMSWRDVPSDYFAQFSLAPLAGRLPTVAEYETRAPVLVMSRTTVRFLFGSEDSIPIGRRISIVGAPRGTPKWYTVVGVVPDVRTDPNFHVADPPIYSFQGLPLSQRSGTVILKTSADPNLVVRSLRDQLARFDASVIVNDAATVKSHVKRWKDAINGTMWWVTAVAVLAFVLATVGVFGLTSYAAEVRSREIGIHVALGASDKRVVGLMLADLTAVAVVALGGGIFVGMKVVVIVDNFFRDHLVSQPMASFLITPIVGAAIGLLIIALAGTFIPIRRLLKQDLARVMQA